MSIVPDTVNERLSTTTGDSQLATHGALWLIISVLILPIALAAVYSTQTTNAVYQITNVFPGSALVENYTTVLFEYNFGQYMWNSFVMATVVIVGKLVFSLLAATALVYYDFRFQSLIFYAILFTLLMPLPVRIVPLYQLMADIGWLNSFAGLTSPFIASATAVFLFRQQFRSIPASVVETAKLDGIGPIQFLANVLIPMSKGMIAGVTAIMFISTWNAYLWPLVAIIDRTNQVAQVGLRYIQGTGAEGFVQWNLVMAAGILVLIPPLIVLLVARRYLLSTLGGGE
ncbi:carbohydrate ABC transporter permease [Halosegnis longus]|uniref:carbohydrate ABC transporter permease n=1 Tax=Halosegnis longus TaxID=2216012 RepID=UPI001EF11D46|nr:carbohydrate ABC transporter permease [Halosegnis longus]